MTVPPKPRVLVEGESVATVAVRGGLDADAVWNLDENADLRSKRTDADVLAPGDILYVPDRKARWLPATVGSTNQYKTPPAKLFARLQCVDEEGNALPDSAYVVENVDPPLKGTMSGGVIELAVPGDSRLLHIHLTDLETTLVAEVAGLDPVDDPHGRGVGQRMAALAIAPPVPALATGEARRIVEAEYLAAAIGEFQKKQGVDVTGVVDDPTRAALVKAHGA